MRCDLYGPQGPRLRRLCCHPFKLVGFGQESLLHFPFAPTPPLSAPRHHLKIRSLVLSIALWPGARVMFLLAPYLYETLSSLWNLLEASVTLSVDGVGA